MIRESVRHQTETLTAGIMAPLRSSLGDDGVVLIPAGPLAGIPWSVLPDLRGRPVTVCPSASSWLAARRRKRAAVGMMTAYHRLLAAGTSPAEALAAATASEPFSPFVCFGAG